MSDILRNALSQYGITEIPGKENNPEIMKYFSIINQDWVQGDETAWCSAYVNWCCIVSGKPASMQLNARSWLGVGKKIITPRTGDIVIFWRVSHNDWRGHVGFYISEDDSWIYTLGGNQSNQVNISKYSKNRVLGYRRV